MIVDQAVYRDGRRQPCADLSDELALLRSEGAGFIWIGLKDPSAAEFALVQDELALHPLAVEDAVKGRQRPKLDVYGDSLFVVLKTLQYIDATSDVETGEVMIFTGDRFVVTVRRGEVNPLSGVRRRLEATPEQLAHGPTAVLYSVMDAIVDNYTAIDAELDEDVVGIERRTFSELRAVHARDIYRLKREVLEVRRAALPLVMVVRRLAGERLDLVNADARPYFADISDHLLRVVEHAEAYDRLLSDVLSAHLAQISVQQNDDMRRISAWVAIAAVPTMVAGIYGMNFETMPELTASVSVAGRELQYGYFLVLAVMAGVCLALFRAFKRSGWL